MLYDIYQYGDSHNHHYQMESLHQCQIQLFCDYLVNFK